MILEEPKKILGEGGYTDDEFSRLSDDEKARIKGYMWSKNLGGLIKPPSLEGTYGPYSLTFLTNEELVDLNQGEETKYMFLDTASALTLNKKAVLGGQTHTNHIIHYAQSYTA